MLRIKLLANRIDWKSLKGRVLELERLLSKRLGFLYGDVKIDIVPSNYPLVLKDGLLTADCFNKMIDVSYDATCLLLEKKVWTKLKGRFGLHGLQRRPIPTELSFYVIANEDQLVNSRDLRVPCFEETFEHELAHAVYEDLGSTDKWSFIDRMFLNGYDNTHYFYYVKKDLDAMYADIAQLWKARAGKLTAILQRIRELMNQISPAKRFVSIAKSKLGQDASPFDAVNDSVGCAESLSMIIRQLDPAFPFVTGTWSLLDALRSSLGFRQLYSIEDIEVGDVVLAVTGQGNGSVSNGHAGIVIDTNSVASNDSKTGKFLANYTVDSFVEYFNKKGGYPIYIFRPV